MSTLVETKNLKKYYGKKPSLFNCDSRVLALDGVSLIIEKEKSLALIGESGSGKSTLGRMIAGLENPMEGSVFFNGKDITNLSLKKMIPYRKNIQIIFQNNTSVFNPCYTIGESIKETIINYETLDKKEINLKLEEILRLVGLDESYQHRYVGELSGGQKQRANIARALVLHPEFVICDEPVSSLDYSIRKQILKLLNDMGNRFHITYLFITHDLSNIEMVCDCVAIMYAGKIVEYIDSTNELEMKIMHPYTKVLFSSIPIKDPFMRKNRKEEVDVETGKNIMVETGCRFHKRCKYCHPICMEKEPLLKEISKGHMVSCHMIP